MKWLLIFRVSQCVCVCATTCPSIVCFSSSYWLFTLQRCWCCTSPQKDKNQNKAKNKQFIRRKKVCVWLCMLKSSVTRSILASFSRWLILSCWFSYLISIFKNVWQVPLFRFSSKREPIRFSSFFFFLFSIWYTKYCIFFFWGGAL
jgi:hypothetical protein